MTDSMNFGPDWIRNLPSEGNVGGTGSVSTGGSTGGTRYQLAEYRYGAEEMLALFDKSTKPPACLANFKSLFSEMALSPLALTPTSEEERSGWVGRPLSLIGIPSRGGRGVSLERGGGRIGRPGRGGYMSSYNRSTPSNYESSWGNGDQSEWSPRKEFNVRPSSLDNWRKSKIGGSVGNTNIGGDDDGDGWRLSATSNRGGGGGSVGGNHIKWNQPGGGANSWRKEPDNEERSSNGGGGGGGSNGNGTSDRNAPSRPWHEINNKQPPPPPPPSLSRKTWDNDDNLPEWANVNPLETGGSFDDRGAFHGSDEQLEIKEDKKKDGLQKSASHQHIVGHNKSQHPPLPPPLVSSKSALSLVKNLPESEERVIKNYRHELGYSSTIDQKLEMPFNPDEVKQLEPGDEIDINSTERVTKNNERKMNLLRNENKTDDNDFEKLQEDFVLKLVVDEEIVEIRQKKKINLPALTPPPNLPVPGQEKWFYQDPQGQMQGPFTNIEMSEWFKAGYFGQDLKVRRQCDERFFLLGELILICGGSNPFQASTRFPILKSDITKMAENDLLQFQYLSQLSTYKQAQNRLNTVPATDPWNTVALQHPEIAQRLIVQQQQQIQPDLQYLQNSTPANPLMHMISQMQQANKVQPAPAPALIEKQTGALDLHLHMNNLLSLQNRLPTSATLTNQMQSSVPIPGSVAAAAAAGGGSGGGSVTAPGLPGNLQPTAAATALGPVTGVPLPGFLHQNPSPLGLNVQPLASDCNPNQDNGAISSLLKQLQQRQKQNQVESLWQQNHQFVPTPTTRPLAATQQWSPGAAVTADSTTPLSMWDIQQSNTAIPIVNQQLASQLPQQQQQQQDLISEKIPTESVAKLPPGELDYEKKIDSVQKQAQAVATPTRHQQLNKEDEKEQKRKKKIEEEKHKKELEEKRKQEQKKLELEKKAEAERKKKEEEKIRKELEKAKREAEEKRQRELAEKRRIREQKKQEEENRKKAEELKKLEEIRLLKEKQEKQMQAAEETRRQEQQSFAKAAPWCQANLNLSMSLAEIQKLEKEKKVQEAAAAQAQKAQLEKEIQAQQQFERVCNAGGLGNGSGGTAQFSWAKKPLVTKKVQSLAEIQAEEQERLAKEVAEARLKKTKENREQSQLQNTNSIWAGQSLTWANATPSSSSINTTNNNNGQWLSSSNAGNNHVTSGFWEESVSKLHQQQNQTTTINKPSISNSKTSSTTANAVASVSSSKQRQNQQQPEQQATKPQKSKTKKDDTLQKKNNINDEFMNWCHKTLEAITSNIDIPTFITFLRDIESAYEVRDYCKAYLGESNATQQFANSFLEKRRSFKSTKNSYKDDMCSPAPAITPQQHSSNDFQEFKGKNKKPKKSKMLKVDSRILGFNVTSAPDRINVGDRDYGDNS